ncbi:hypothetical protein NST89_18480 [Caldifermentibacillus hisashii]|jgi:hypothetical protein|uniref:hypothetical protein n=1 Tax=Caldifermentibacillus hisashii TaxID=996558 RepID=UPI0031369B8F
MRKYQFISCDPYIQAYVDAMAKWIERNSSSSYNDIYKVFEQNALKLKRLFEPYPEDAFHDDPEKWAELLAISWNLIEEKELEFV